MKDDDFTIPCPHCGAPMTGCINAVLNVRTYWLCEKCNHFEAAIGRERLIDKPEGKK